MWSLPGVLNIGLFGMPMGAWGADEGLPTCWWWACCAKTQARPTGLPCPLASSPCKPHLASLQQAQWLLCKLQAGSLAIAPLKLEAGLSRPHPNLPAAALRPLQPTSASQPRPQAAPTSVAFRETPQRSCARAGLRWGPFIPSPGTTPTSTPATRRVGRGRLQCQGLAGCCLAGCWGTALRWEPYPQLASLRVSKQSLPEVGHFATICLGCSFSHLP